MEAELRLGGGSGEGGRALAGDRLGVGDVPAVTLCLLGAPGTFPG